MEIHTVSEEKAPQGCCCDDTGCCATPAAESTDELIAGIRAMIEDEIAPVLAGDGGSAEFVGFEDGVVSLRLVGACSGCPHSAMTLKMVIEARLQQRFGKAVQSVVAVR
jgi:Fe-S cluster biogenesis protein NfuA